jgi:hypothetical protein
MKKPELPALYLGFLVGVASVPDFMLGLMRLKKESKRAMEMRRVREKLKRKKDLERMRTERESETLKSESWILDGNSDEDGRPSA